MRRLCRLTLSYTQTKSLALTHRSAGPVCSVPGCSGPPSPSPSPGPFRPVNASNCTYLPHTGSKDHRVVLKRAAGSRSECCQLCFLSSQCVLASLKGGECFLHATTTDTVRAEDVTACVTGRTPGP